MAEDMNKKDENSSEYLSDKTPADGIPAAKEEGADLIHIEDESRISDSYKQPSTEDSELTKRDKTKTSLINFTSKEHRVAMTKLKDEKDKLEKELKEELNIRDKKISRRNKVIVGMGVKLLLASCVATWFGYNYLQLKDSASAASPTQISQKADGRDNKINLLEKTLNTTQDSLNSTKKELEDSKGEYAKLSQEYNNLETEYNSTTAVIAQSEDKIKSLKGKLQDDEVSTDFLKKEIERLQQQYNEANSRLAGLDKEKSDLKKKLESIPPQIQYENVKLGKCKYELTDKQAKEEGFDMLDDYDKMSIYENNYVILSKGINIVKVYSEKKIEKPISINGMKLDKQPVQDEGLFEFITELEKE